MGNFIFRENVVIITGASLGIGRELAFQLADQGAWLALAARNAEKLAEVVQECRERGGKAIAIPTDVAIQSQCQDLVQRAVAEYGRVDTLINNAGINLVASFSELKDLAIYQNVFQVNFFGSVYCTFYALPYLKESRGRLVGVSSLRGKFPGKSAHAYAESKHAMAAFFDSLRIELMTSGVSVTMIYPGWINTGMTSRDLRPDGKPAGESVKKEGGGMSVETCAHLILQAVGRRKREEVMTWLGKLGLWIKTIAPGYMDQLIRFKM